MVARFELFDHERYRWPGESTFRPWRDVGFANDKLAACFDCSNDQPQLVGLLV